MTWPTFRTEAPFQELKVSEKDVKLATMAFGWTLGFGYFVAWHAFKQSKRFSAFTVMCWLEILASLTLAVMSWLYLCKVIRHSFWVYFMIVTLWALQVQFLLQIIVNRICILLPIPRQRFWLKFTVAAWITSISISVYCIWLPSKLQISKRFHDINVWWDRTEKILYLFTDGVLNFMFIRSIKKRLVSMGLNKYDKLVKFNERIIVVSLSMDLLIILMMSYPNDLVYLQFHPVAYLVKLEIEMCMSKLMVKVATGTGIHVLDDELSSRSGSRPRSSSHQPSGYAVHHTRSVPTMGIQIATHIESRAGDDIELGGSKPYNRTSTIRWERERPVVVTQDLSDAKGGDASSVISNRGPPSWGGLGSSKHMSSISVITKDTDLERGGSPEPESMGGIMVSCIGFPPQTPK